MNDESADTLPAPPPPSCALEARVSALEGRADQQAQAFDELEQYLENKFEVLREDIREWFRRMRAGVHNGGG